MKVGDILNHLKVILFHFLLALLIFFPKASAKSIEEQQWVLNSNQYIRYADSSSTYSSSLNKWGEMSIPYGRSVYEYGAYVSNPVCDLDYCIAPNSSYIFSFVLTASNSNFANLQRLNQRIGTKDSINLRLSYLNSNNQTTWVNINKNSISNYSMKPYSVNGNNISVKISFVASIPDIPQPATTSHFMTLDFWVISTGNAWDNPILYTSSNNTTTGISLFIVQYATPVDIGNMEDQNITIGNQNEIINNQNSTNEKFDEFLDADISNADKELPSNSGFNEYESKENQLKNYINRADISAVDISIDSNTSSWIWTTLTSLIQSNMLVFGMIISILSVGIIKLALGR